MVVDLQTAKSQNLKKLIVLGSEVIHVYKLYKFKIELKVSKAAKLYIAFNWILHLDFQNVGIPGWIHRLSAFIGWLVCPFSMETMVWKIHDFLPAKSGCIWCFFSKYPSSCHLWGDYRKITLYFFFQRTLAPETYPFFWHVYSSVGCYTRAGDQLVRHHYFSCFFLSEIVWCPWYPKPCKPRCERGQKATIRSKLMHAES